MQAAHQPTAGRNRNTRLRIWAFRLCALLVIPALFFGLLEGVLRLRDVGYPTAFLQPSATHDGQLVDNYKFAWRFFPRAIARSPQPITVAAQKPAGLRRIVVFGESAAMGDPEPAYGLPRMLQALLEFRYPDQSFEVTNAAVTAINSHVILPIAGDCRMLDADAWVVYMGNNEVHGPYGAGTVFGKSGLPLWVIRGNLALQRTRLGQLLSGRAAETSEAVPKSWGGMGMFLEHTVSHDEPELQRVYQHFAANLDDLLDTAASTDVPVVVSTVVSNLRDLSPFVSLHARGLSDTSRAEWEQFYQQGCAAQDEERWPDAVTAFRQALQYDAEHAELHFRLGQCLLATGEAKEARGFFERARDLDGLRFRADTRLNDIIRATASRHAKYEDRVRLIDAERSLAEASPQAIVGDEFLYEHVHLNFAGNYRLARQFAETLAELLKLPAGSDSAWPDEQQCAARLGVTPYHQLLVLNDVKSRFNAPPFDRQTNHARRLKQLDEQRARLSRAMTAQEARSGVARYRELLEKHPRDWMLRRQFSALLESTGDVNGAAEQWRLIAEQLPHHFESYYRFGMALNRAKQWEQAEQALRRSLELRPEHPGVHNSLGICLSHREKLEECYAEFQQAVALKPDYAEAYQNWALVVARHGDTTRARQLLEQATQADPDYLPAHQKLGEQYVNESQYEAAKPHYAAVARLLPQDVAAQMNLGLLYLKLSRGEEAIRQLERVLELEPGNRIARQAIAQARQLGKQP